MTKDILKGRTRELAKAVEESLENHQRIKVALDNATNNHHVLVGRLNEATELHQKFSGNELKKLEKDCVAE